MGTTAAGSELRTSGKRSTPRSAPDALGLRHPALTPRPSGLAAGDAKKGDTSAPACSVPSRGATVGTRRAKRESGYVARAEEPASKPFVRLEGAARRAAAVDALRHALLLVSVPGGWLPGMGRTIRRALRDCDVRRGAVPSYVYAEEVLRRLVPLDLEAWERDVMRHRDDVVRVLRRALRVCGATLSGNQGGWVVSR